VWDVIIVMCKCNSSSVSARKPDMTRDYTGLTLYVCLFIFCVYIHQGSLVCFHGTGFIDFEALTEQTG